MHGKSPRQIKEATFKNLSIDHDYTQAQRKMKKQLLEEAKAKEYADKSGNFIYRVRGMPD